MWSGGFFLFTLALGMGLGWGIRGWFSRNA
jgi:hypothetical protein